VPRIINRPWHGKTPWDRRRITTGASPAKTSKIRDRYELNGRVREKGKLVEQVYRAGGDEALRLGARLGRSSSTSKRRWRFRRRPARSPVTSWYLRTGDNEEYRQQDIAWLKQVSTVDYILGFVETYTDVRGRKGGFEGFVAIPDPERDPPLQALAKSAQYFEQKMPWDAKWKRDSFQTPASAAVTVLAAAGDAGPFTFSGRTSQRISEKGSKNSPSSDDGYPRRPHPGEDD
jgi:dipeptidyl-peptidase-3